MSPDRVDVLVVHSRREQTADFFPEAILCSGEASIYKTFAHEAGIALRRLNVQQGIRAVEGAYIQSVNAYDIRLKTWMCRFHRIAAKCFEHYLGWHCFRERYRDTISLRRASTNFPRSLP